MRLLFLSHTADTGVFRVGSHHLARELATRGHRVVHATTAVTPAHVLRLGDPDLRDRGRRALRGPWRDEHGVLHFVARAPWPPGSTPGPLEQVAARACARSLRRMLRRDGMAEVDVLLVDKPAFAWVVPHLDAAKVVYRATDRHDHDRFRGAVAQLMERVDAAIATSQVVMESLGPRHRELPSLVLENGVEFERFAALRETEGEGAVYVGALDYRFDWETLCAMAEASPDAEFRLGGPVDGRPPSLPANVELCGPIPYARAPQFVAGGAVGLLPLAEGGVNDGRSPMKYFEYLAAGLYVVAKATPTLAAQPAAGATLYGTREEAAAAVADQLARGPRNLAGTEAARPYDWRERAAELESFIAGL
jgi:hypothetical protein